MKYIKLYEQFTEGFKSLNEFKSWQYAKDGLVNAEKYGALAKKFADQLRDEGVNVGGESGIYFETFKGKGEAVAIPVGSNQWYVHFLNGDASNYQSYGDGLMFNLLRRGTEKGYYVEY